MHWDLFITRLNAVQSHCIGIYALYSIHYVQSISFISCKALGIAFYLLRSLCTHKFVCITIFELHSMHSILCIKLYLLRSKHCILCILVRAACVRCHGTKCPLLTVFFLFLCFSYTYFSPRRG